MIRERSWFRRHSNASPFYFLSLISLTPCQSAIREWKWPVEVAGGWGSLRGAFKNASPVFPWAAFLAKERLFKEVPRCPTAMGSLENIRRDNWSWELLVVGGHLNMPPCRRPPTGISCLHGSVADMLRQLIPMERGLSPWGNHLSQQVCARW